MPRIIPSIYSLALSDGSLRNGLILPNETILSLKLSLLLFDDIFISAPALLRNHVLFDLANLPKEREAIKTIHKKHIRPVLIEGNRNILDVAQNVICAPSPIFLSDPKRATRKDLIEKHAEIIHSSYRARPRYLKISKDQFHRPKYFYGLKQMLQLLSTEGVLWWPNNVSKDSIQSFLKVLPKERDKQENFTVRDAYNLADSNLKGEAKRFIKASSFIIMECITSSKKMKRLLPCAHAAQTIDALGQAIEPLKLEDQFSTAQVVKTSYTFPYFIPPKKLLPVGFADILRLRPYFSQLRTDLFAMSQSRTSIDDLNNNSEKILLKAKKQLDSFLDSEDKGDWFSAELDRKKKYWMKIELDALCFEGKVAVVALGIHAGLPHLAGYCSDVLPFLEEAPIWNNILASYLTTQLGSIPVRLRKSLGKPSEQESRPIE